VTETFFLPEEVGRKAWSIPSDIYNLASTLLARSEFGCVFVPIRSLQFLAVITGSEIVFVDSQSYAYNQQQGGRLIMLAWKYLNTASRQALNQPVECEVRFYHPESSEIQLRLTVDFRKALEQLDRRYRDQALPPDGARILKLGKGNAG
jgi:hypothetical protein